MRIIIQRLASEGELSHCFHTPMSTTNNGNITNKENEGTNNSSSSTNPSLNKNIIVYATDMTEDQRITIINIAQRAFQAPASVNQSKVYVAIADAIRVEFEKEYDCSCGVGDAGASITNVNVGGGGSSKVQQHGSSSSSGGWNCVVGDAFGSSVTHRMKTYIHFSVVPRVNILLWRS
jgi:hypothetical protein